jgi:hypothetical protein
LSIIIKFFDWQIDSWMACKGLRQESGRNQILSWSPVTTGIISVSF